MIDGQVLTGNAFRPAFRRQERVHRFWCVELRFVERGTRRKCRGSRLPLELGERMSIERQAVGCPATCHVTIQLQFSHLLLMVQSDRGTDRQKHTCLQNVRVAR